MSRYIEHRREEVTRRETRCISVKGGIYRRQATYVVDIKYSVSREQSQTKTLIRPPSTASLHLSLLGRQQAVHELDIKATHVILCGIRIYILPCIPLALPYGICPARSLGSACSLLHKFKVSVH